MKLSICLTLTVSREKSFAIQKIVKKPLKIVLHASCLFLNLTAQSSMAWLLHPQQNLAIGFPRTKG